MIDSSIRTDPCTQSMSDHRMAQISPLRAPDAAVTRMNNHRRRSSPASAAAMIARTSATLGARTGTACSP
jgi:hypothetical protein